MEGHRGRLIVGAVAGVAVVAVPAVLLGEILREPPHPGVVVAFVLLGAVLGAFAWGTVGYERDHEAPDASSAYRKGALADLPAPGVRAAEPEPVAEPEHSREPQPGLVWLLRHRAQSFLKLPLTPWI